jgi:hypothetical protein
VKVRGSFLRKEAPPAFSIPLQSWIFSPFVYFPVHWLKCQEGFVQYGITRIGQALA